VRDRIFDGLNEDQAAAVAAVTGPVCILAGAGSGKTTTITARIANQVATGAFPVSDILAVTFTDKAARQMASRLAALGVPGVRARTFHAEALAQYRALSQDATEILPSKAQILAPLVRNLAVPYKFCALRDVAAEIEWAKNGRLGADRYLAEAKDREPPLPLEFMAGIYAAYERRKARAGFMDFEDLLERAIDLLGADPSAFEALGRRYRAFTVDEYQDVNLLQQTLLEAWAGDGDDLCVVGDDYQSIFGFTGATPGYLLGFPARYEGCRTFQLTENYRSSPQVLAAANRLAPSLGGAPKELRPVRDAGPEPAFREFATAEGETEWIVGEAVRLREGGLPWEEIAVLYRINGRSEALEEAFTAAAIPYQVRDSAFLRRPAARAVLQRLKRAPAPGVAAAVEEAVRRLGYREDEEFQGEEATRQADLARLVQLARQYSGDDGVEGFVRDLQRRFASEEDGSGVQILTYHRAKGLEFEAVFLPRLEDRELPFALAKAPEALAEERRLLYVGITRAKRFLFVSWARLREGERRRRPAPSPFLKEIRPPPAVPGAHATPFRRPSDAARASASEGAAGTSELFETLRRWRLAEARERGVSAFVVFADRTLREIVERCPRTLADLETVSGVGPTKIARYGEQVLAIIERYVEPSVPPSG
jgi:DNA helicase-2/ATP-dependent DNA helicase PcrA